MNPSTSTASPAPAALAPVDLLLAAGGPMAVGAVLGLHRGPLAMLPGALSLPAVVLGVTIVMMPALYIGAALAGVAPPARQVAVSLARGFRACGVVMLGLTAPVLFLLATTQSNAMAVLLGGAATAAGALAGLRLLYADLFQAPSPRIWGAFGLWSLVALALGVRMYLSLVIA